MLQNEVALVTGLPAESGGRLRLPSPGRAPG